ncbi:expressed conserved protein [Echinococcus multilocularis]|uniref:Expressed conserved protein n=1 Tax=Echinococcus multilocularis TaxID=6211 RepID=A0A068YM25_ECHMU|nr:expressed conserved protein [Echinococcus multilocularis]
MAIAGLGLECRSGGRCGDTGIGTAAQLARFYGCRGTELISCDGQQMAAGIFSLYAAACPERFNEVNEVPDEEEKEQWRKKM